MIPKATPQDLKISYSPLRSTVAIESIHGNKYNNRQPSERELLQRRIPRH
jgi:hypothetical protein